MTDWGQSVLDYPVVGTLIRRVLAGEREEIWDAGVPARFLTAELIASPQCPGGLGYPKV